MADNSISYNSAYISMNLLDELDFYLGGYGKPNFEFLFTLNTFVETFIGSSSFYTSLNELNHLNLTTSALFPNGRPILNMVVKEGGLRFLNGVLDKSGREIYRASTYGRTRKESQQDFIIEYGAKIHSDYFLKSDVTKVVDNIPLVTAHVDDEDFVVSEVLSRSDELVSNLLGVSRISSIQTTLPIYLYGQQISSLTNTPYSIKSLDKIAKTHEANLQELLRSLNYRVLPIPPFANILLGQVTSISDIPQKLSQLRADYQGLREKFMEFEQEIAEAPNLKSQLSAFRKFEEFWLTFNHKYLGQRSKIVYGTLDVSKDADFDKGADSLLDGESLSDSFKDLNLGKLGGNILTKGIQAYKDRKIVNRFKGLTNIWELFQDGKGINQQIQHIERLFGVQFSTTDINNVHEYVKSRLTDISSQITNN